MTRGGLTGQQRQGICQVLARFPAVRGARLYGSRALGRSRPSSDIDLTLEGDIDLTTLNRISLVLDDLLLPYEIDLSVFGQIDNPELRDYIQHAGRLFYQKNEPSKTLESPNRADKISG